MRVSTKKGPTLIELTFYYVCLTYPTSKFRPRGRKSFENVESFSLDNNDACCPIKADMLVCHTPPSPKLPAF